MKRKRRSKKEVLARISLAMKRHYDNHNSYRAKPFTVVVAYSSEFESIIIMAEARQHVDRYGARKGPESSFILTYRNRKWSASLGMA